MNTTEIKQIIQAFEGTNNILILPSQPADGDSIGSALALFEVLQSKGKNASVVLTTEVPDIYKFLPATSNILPNTNVYSDFIISVDLRNAEVANIKHEIVDNKINLFITPKQGTLLAEQVSFPKPEKKYDLIVVVDAASPMQLGDFYKQNYLIFGEIPSINIDHHESNTRFASLNLVNTNASSTTQIIYEILKEYKFEITADIATYLLTGLITDTGSFQNDNTTPEAFDLAAELIELGGRQQEIIRYVYKTKQLQTLKLWGKILSNIQVDPVNKLVWSGATLADFSETMTTQKDIGDIIDDLIANAEEANLAMLMVENPDGSLHVSIRTKDDARNAAKLAEKFGGGGHARASGFTLENATIASHAQSILHEATAETLEMPNFVAPNTPTTPNDPATPNAPTVEVEKAEELQVEKEIPVPSIQEVPSIQQEATPVIPNESEIVATPINPTTPVNEAQNTTTDPLDDEKRIEKMAIDFISGQDKSQDKS